MTVVLVGQTASGKTVIAKELEKLGYKRAIQYTTRPKREGEIDGVDYHFVTKQSFENLRKNGFFAEYASYRMVCGTHFWGSSFLDYVGDGNKIIILNPDGVRQIVNRHIPCTIIYLKPPIDVLTARAVQRGDDPAEVIRRLENDQEKFDELEDQGWFTLSIDTSKTCSVKAAEEIDRFLKMGL